MTLDNRLILMYIRASALEDIVYGLTIAVDKIDEGMDDNPTAQTLVDGMEDMGRINRVKSEIEEVLDCTGGDQQCAS